MPSIFSGCVSGVTTRFITQPLDIIKLRTQIVRHGSSQVHWLQVIKAVFKEEGFTAFWRGHNMGQLHSILAVSSQFYIYEIATQYTYKSLIYNSELKPFATFACGLFAGSVSATLMMPLEVVRVRQMMVKDQYKGIVNGVRRVYRYGGIPAFYSGLGASLLQMGPAIGISFSVFNTVQERLLTRLSMRHCGGDCHLAKGNTALPLDLALASSLAGCLAGFISKTLTYPFDLAKRRLQIASHRDEHRYKGHALRDDFIRCDRLLDCLRDTVKNEGYVGLFRGWPLAIFSAQSHRTKQRFTSPAVSEGFIRCNKLFDCLRLTVEREGLKGLFRGWKVTIFKAQMTNIVAYTTYELVCYALRDLED